MIDAVLHYCFRCVKCDGWIRLQVSTLHTLPEFPIFPASDTASVALSCRHCKRVSVYRLRGTAAPHPIEEDFVFWRELRCEEKSCRTPLKVIGVRRIAMSSEEIAKDVATWRWDELRCPNGYLILKTDNGT